MSASFPFRRSHPPRAGGLPGGGVGEPSSHKGRQVRMNEGAGGGRATGGHSIQGAQRNTRSHWPQMKPQEAHTGSRRSGFKAGPCPRAAART